MRSATTTLRGHPSSVPAARRWVLATLRDWGLDDTGWTAAQIVSELATNCTLHARGDFTLRIDLDGRCVRLEAVDTSPVPLQARSYGPLATTGRGLGIVAMLATDWGVTPQDEGKAVWVLLVLDEAETEPPEQEARSGQAPAPGTAAASPGGTVAHAVRAALARTVAA